MKLDFGETTLRINISFAAAVTLTLIIDESGFCAAALFCCVVHELGHIICLLIFGEKPRLIELSFYGIRLERKNDCLKNIENIAVYASGPLANFVLSAAFFAASSTEIARNAAATSLCVGLFNMLPCVPLDGGNLLNLALLRFVDDEECRKICLGVSLVVILPLMITGFLLLIKNGNVTLIAVSVYLTVMTFLDNRGRFF